MALLYILQHLFSLLLLTKFHKVYAFLSLICFFLIFIFKANSYDLIAYEKMFSYQNYRSYEFFFVKFIDSIKFFSTDGKTIITIYQLTLIGLAASIMFFFKTNRFLILAVTISSVGFMLAVHNNLRQGMSSILILISIFSYFHGNKKLAISLLLFSIGFHRATIYFVSLILCFGLIYKIITFIYKFKHSMYVIYGLAFISSIFCYFGIIGIVQYSNLSGYENKILSINSNRWSLGLKIILLLFSSILVEIFLKFRRINNDLDFVRFLKLCLIFTLFFLSINGFFDELGARILFYYFIIELGLIIYLTNYKLYNTLVLILISYMFAFNVINILGGI